MVVWTGGLSIQVYLLFLDTIWEEIEGYRIKFENLLYA